MIVVFAMCSRPLIFLLFAQSTALPIIKPLLSSCSRPNSLVPSARISLFPPPTEFRQASEPCRLKVKPLHYFRSSSSGSLPVITLKRASSSFIPSPAIISMRSSCNSRLRCSSSIF